MKLSGSETSKSDIIETAQCEGSEIATAPKLPAGWKLIPLKEVCDSSAFGPRFGAEFYAVNGNVSVLRTTDLDDHGNIDYETVPRAQLDLDRFESHFLRTGDFLVTRSGTCGIAAVFAGYTKPVLPGAFLIRFRLKSHVEPQFIRYYFNSRAGRDRVTQIATGAVQQNLTSTALHKLLVPLPPIAEQKRIVFALDSVASAKRARQRELALLRERHAALANHLFSNGIHESKDGAPPRTWKLTTLSEVCNGGAQNGAFIKNARFGEGTRYANVYDIYQNAVLVPERLQRLECDESTRQRYRIEENDILFVRSSLKRPGVGQCCLVGKLTEPVIFDCHLIRVSPDPSKVDPHYLAYFFLSEPRRHDLIARSKTTTMTTINQGMLTQSTVLLPTLAEQREIAKILSISDHALALLAREIGLLEQLHSGMTEELMSGRVCTNSLNDGLLVQ